MYCYQKKTPMGGDLARQLSQSIKLVIALNLLLPTVTNWDLPENSHSSAHLHIGRVVHGSAWGGNLCIWAKWPQSTKWKKTHLRWPLPLNAVVEEGIGHQVGDNGKVVDGDVIPHAAGVLVQNQVRQGSVFGCCWERLLLRKEKGDSSFLI